MRLDNPTKCQYRGSWTLTGCNEDVVPGTDFCHAHRDQGPANRIQSKVMGWGCLVSIVLLALVITLALTGVCESADAKCADSYFTIGDSYASMDERNEARLHFRQNCHLDRYNYPVAN